MTVIGMIVRPEHGIQPMDIVGQKLRAQIGGRIDKNAAAGLTLQHDRNTRAPVLRVGGVALAPVRAMLATEARYAGRRTAAEDRQLHAEAFRNSAKKLRVVTSAR